jgi:hypothetical protein
MTHLYELAANFRALTDKLNESELDPQTIADTLDGEAGELQDKCVNVAKWFKNEDADADKIEEAAKAMIERARAIRKRSAHAADMTNQGPVTPTALQSIRDGFWVGVLNPKAIVFFAAVLPQFVDIDGGNVTAQLLFMGLVFCLLAFISDGKWGLLAGTARQWLATDARRLESLRAFGGVVMITLGVLVLISAIQAQ